MSSPQPLLPGPGARQLGVHQPFLHATQIGRDVGGDLPGVTGSVEGRRRQAPTGDGDQLELGPASVEPGAGIAKGGPGGQLLDVVRGAAHVGRLAAQDFAEDGAQPEDVSSLVEPVGLAARLLGRHVSRGAQHRPCPRGSGTAAIAVANGPDGVAEIAPRSLLIGGSRRTEHFGQSPVHDLHLAEPAHHDIGRFEVAVNDAASMSVGNRLADVFEDPQQPGPVVTRMLTLTQERGQGAALDELHGEIRPVIGERAQLMDGNDSRVLELPADLGLLDEPADQFGVLAVRLEQDLDRQIAAEVGVSALEDGPHAATGDLTEELVSARE